MIMYWRLDHLNGTYIITFKSDKSMHLLKNNYYLET